MVHEIESGVNEFIDDRAKTQIYKSVRIEPSAKRYFYYSSGLRH